MPGCPNKSTTPIMDGDVLLTIILIVVKWLPPARPICTDAAWSTNVSLPLFKVLVAPSSCCYGDTWCYHLSVCWQNESCRFFNWSRRSWIINFGVQLARGARFKVCLQQWCWTLAWTKERVLLLRNYSALLVFNIVLNPYSYFMLPMQMKSNNNISLRSEGRRLFWATHCRSHFKRSAVT